MGTSWIRSASEQLDRWATSPSEFADDSVEPPTIDAIEALRTLLRLHDRFAYEPSSVKMTGDGGVSISWKRGHGVFELEVDREGAAELLIFFRGSIVFRGPFKSFEPNGPLF